MLRLWFGFRARVNQKTYLTCGVLLFALKLGVDWALVSAYASLPFDFLNYFNPILSQRLVLLGEYPSWLPLAMGIWALPFIWVGISMTARRAIDAGLSGWFSLLFLLPVVNLLVIAGFCGLPSTPPSSPEAGASALEHSEEPKAHMVSSALLAVLVTSILGVGILFLSVFGLGEYGSALFIATPFVMGVISVLCVHRGGYQGRKASLGVAALSVTICGGVMMLLALEGGMCLLMTSPLAFGLSLLGAVLADGMVCKNRDPKPSILTMALFLPVLTVGEGLMPQPEKVHSVVSSIVIDAPAERIWPNVIGFSELPPPKDWLMKTGVACPLRARIEGSGVGAVRYCEFTTGPFVEPVTVWEPPHRLGFDVVKQPPSMEEWSIWQTVHAPHVVGTMQSKRGEFELITLESGKTVLKGTTWYTLDLAPSFYWTLYSDAIVHRIHNRVLGHIKNLSELDSLR